MTDTEPVKQTFPFKLYHALEWASNCEFSSALTWSESGDAFLVHDREAMVENIIPHFFDHKKWRSFVSPEALYYTLTLFHAEPAYLYLTAMLIALFNTFPSDSPAEPMGV